MQTISENLKSVAARFYLLVRPHAPLPPDCSGGQCARDDACSIVREMETRVQDYIYTEKSGLRGSLLHWLNELSEQARKEGCSRVTFTTAFHRLRRK